jgi:hypothetical protein
MVTVLTLASMLAVGPILDSGPCLAWVPALPSADLREMYESGQTFEEFLGDATRRAEAWQGNYALGEGLEDELVERARAVGGTWYFLAVAVDSCSDSVSTIPYLARLVERVENLDLRIVDSSVGREIMEAHRTPDGRAATPTVVLLDEEWEEAGCFIERPLLLQQWILDRELSGDEVYEQKMAWYAENEGEATIEEFVEMLEAAARGNPQCAN